MIKNGVVYGVRYCLPGRHHKAHRARSCRWQWWFQGNRMPWIHYHTELLPHTAETKSSDPMHFHCHTAERQNRTRNVNTSHTSIMFSKCSLFLECPDTSGHHSFIRLFLLFISIWSHLSFVPRHKRFSQSPHGKLHSVPQLVTEMPVSQNPVHIQINISAWERWQERK